MEYGIFVLCHYHTVVQTDYYDFGPYPSKEDAEKDLVVAKKKLIEGWEIDGDWVVEKDDSDYFAANLCDYRDWVSARVDEYSKVMERKSVWERFENQE